MGCGGTLQGPLTEADRGVVDVHERGQRVERATIAAVAAAAGVGVGTVSRVLNDSPAVSPATRERVRAAITALGYRPSRLAAGLSRGNTRTIAILVPFLTRPSVVARLAGAIAELDAAGYDTVVCNVENASQRDHHLIALTERHRADGILCISLALPRVHLERLDRAEVPIVTVDTRAPRIPSTEIDDFAGGVLATAHLLHLGHQRIGFIGDDRGSQLGFTSTGRRLRGYRQALATQGISLDPELVRLGPHGTEAAESQASALLGRATSPTAIFAASDTQALGVLAAAEQARRAVPEELSVVGYDDIEAAAQLRLTTVRQPLHESGARGARRLVNILHNQPVRPLREILALELVPRSSTGPAPDRTRSVRPTGPSLGMTKPPLRGHDVDLARSGPEHRPARNRPALATEPALSGAGPGAVSRRFAPY